MIDHNNAVDKHQRGHGQTTKPSVVEDHQDRHEQDTDEARGNAGMQRVRAECCRHRLRGL